MHAMPTDVLSRSSDYNYLFSFIFSFKIVTQLPTALSGVSIKCGVISRSYLSSIILYGLLLNCDQVCKRCYEYQKSQLTHNIYTTALNSCLNPVHMQLLYNYYA